MNYLAKAGAIALAASGALALLTGCGPDENYEAYKQARQDYLDSAIAEFNPRSVGEVVCDIAGGEPQSSRGYTRTFVYAGLDSKDSLDSRLVELGYEGSSDSTWVSYLRADIGVAGRVYIAAEDSDELNDLRLSYDPSVCSIPESGIFLVRFEESYSPPKSR